METALHEVGFGRYELIAKIGAGGMGEVFLARATGDAGFEQLFAVKWIPARVGSRTEPGTLLREAALAAQIRHRNVVSIVDFGTRRDGQYLVMEYVEGCTLSELQARHRSGVPARLVVPMLIDVLHGLHAAHSLRNDRGEPLHLVHRDVSPGNVLIGIDGSCRIADFGLARVRDQSTSSHGVRGTVAYMSPEQVTGGNVDQRSDVFSLGVVAWNALTGKKLFHDATEQATMSNIVRLAIPRPSTVGLAPPAAFDPIVMTALDRDPDRRYESSEQMAIALRDAAIKTECLAGPNEIAEWVARTFAADLENRRRAIRAASANRSAPLELGLLPQLEKHTSTSTRFATIGDLSRPSNEDSELVPLVAVPPVRRRRRTAETAVIATVVVGAVLGWRWTATAPAARTRPVIEVVAVRAVPPPAAHDRELAPMPVAPAPPVDAAAAIAAPVPAPEPSAAVTPIPSLPPGTGSHAAAAPEPPGTGRTTPDRTTTRRSSSVRPKRVDARPPPKPPVEPAAPPPDAAAPTLESNPYVYK